MEISSNQRLDALRSGDSAASQVSASQTLNRQFPSRTSVSISGIATALPEFSISQEEAALHAVNLGVTEKYRKSLTTLYRRSGVERRHCVILSSGEGAEAIQDFYTLATPENPRGPLTSERMNRYETDAVKLAVRAARQALRNAEISADAITHLVTVSCSGFAAPGVDLALFDELGLPRGVERAHVGFMGCHGALNGLRVARGWAASDPDARVLVCAVELCSLHHQYTDNAQQLVANALFSDGAAAFVVSQEATAGTDCQVMTQASYVIPQTQEMMSWRIADNGFLMTLSPKVPEIIVDTLKPWMTQWLANQGLTIADIQSWAVHPGGPRILTATAEALELPTEVIGHSEAILASHGNMSSPTVFFILQRIQQLTDRGPTVMLGFGPGLTIEAALLNW